MTPRFYTSLLVFGMLSAGTVNTLTRKYVYDTESLGDATLATEKGLAGCYSRFSLGTTSDRNHYHKFRKVCAIHSSIS
jgi:hypothetical protein